MNSKFWSFENAGCLLIGIFLLAAGITVTILACTYLPVWFMNTGLFLICGVTIGLITLEILKKIIK